MRIRQPILATIIWAALPAILVSADAPPVSTEPVSNDVNDESALDQPAPTAVADRPARLQLTVPSSDSPLYLAAPLPTDEPPKGSHGWQLIETNSEATGVPAQRSDWANHGKSPVQQTGGAGQLVAMIPPNTTAGRSRVFHLQSSDEERKNSPFRLETIENRTVKVWEGDQPVLAYNFGSIINDSLKEGDRRRRRACYIHPLWGIDGEILTDDHPADHVHHHGVFWTWPHVGIDGKHYDMWLRGDVEQRFVGWTLRQVGPVAAVLGVENGWFIDDRKVAIEHAWIRVFRASKTERVVDLSVVVIPVDRPITLRGAAGKSYGGMTIRFVPRDNKDATITVPSGPTREDLPDTQLPWADLTATFNKAGTRSGAALFVSPNHPDYPPSWLTRHYGPLCIGWPGVDPRTLPVGKPVQLDYRVWVHSGEVDTKAIATAYEGYTTSIQGKWNRN